MPIEWFFPLKHTDIMEILEGLGLDNKALLTEHPLVELHLGYNFTADTCEIIMYVFYIHKL